MTRSGPSLAIQTRYLPISSLPLCRGRTMRAAPPPGLTGSPKETSAGGTADWQPIPHIKLFTNAFVFSVDGTKVAKSVVSCAS